MNMQALMQQAQKMQREMEKAQKDLESKEFEVVSAGGGIKVTIMGSKTIKNILLYFMIDPFCFLDETMHMHLLNVCFEHVYIFVL